MVIHNKGFSLKRWTTKKKKFNSKYPIETRIIFWKFVLTLFYVSVSPFVSNCSLHISCIRFFFNFYSSFAARMWPIFNLILLQVRFHSFQMNQFDAYEKHGHGLWIQNECSFLWLNCTVVAAKVISGKMFKISFKLNQQKKKDYSNRRIMARKFFTRLLLLSSLWQWI